MWPQIWHGGWWLTDPHHRISQHASVFDSSCRPDLTRVSTTTAAQEELRTANRDAYVSTRGHTQSPLVQWNTMSMNSETKKRQHNRKQFSGVIAQRGGSCEQEPIHRGGITSCQQNGACRLFRREVKGNLAADAEWRGGRQSGSSAVGIVWECCSERVWKQNLYSAEPLEPHHKAICNMSNSGTSCSRNRTRWRTGRRGGETARNCDTLHIFAKVTLDHYVIWSRENEKHGKERGGKVRDSR